MLPDAYFGLAKVFLEEYNTASVIRCFERYLASAPDGENLEEARQRNRSIRENI